MPAASVGPPPSAIGELGATSIRVFDLDPERAGGLVADLSRRFPDLATPVAASVEAAVAGADGLVNGTPVGMHFAPGCPVDPAPVRDQGWLFDAGYSPS